MKEVKNTPKQKAKEEEISTEAAEDGGKPSTDFLIVGIGASAGGFEAFQTFLKNMPAETGMAFVFIQHLDPTHESLMPELLDRLTAMSVQQIKNFTKAEPNNVYIIPPNKTLTIERGIFRLKSPAQTRGLRLPIDAFLLSLAEDRNENAVGVILSGSGSDGSIGIKAIKENGGVVFAQEIETSKYDGMPRSAILTGLVDFVYPVREIPARLIEFSKHREHLQNSNGSDGEQAKTESFIGEMCSILRRETGHDFSNYKRSTLFRRIQRRIQVVRAKSVAEYVELMRSDKKEAENLFKDLLIGVTHFFRDREAFETLKTRVVSQIVDGKSKEDTIRVWVPGCATGEEAYSIAMLLYERMSQMNMRIPVQIFATDIDEDSLERARAGCYADSVAEQMPKEYLEEFFTKQGNSYQVSKKLREMCLFSNHNLITHPPFSRLNLVSCRNLLIYLDGNVQKKILPVFHYSLRPDGFLFLGTSESVSGFSDLFRTIDKHNRIFQTKDTVLGRQINFPITGSVRKTRPRPETRPQTASKDGERHIGKVIENILLSSYTPACVIVNERADVVYFFGRTGKYLEPAAGTPSNNILELARKGLRLDLRTALHKAVTSKETITHENITVETGDSLVQRINLKISPMVELGEDSNLFLVVFQDVGAPFSPAEVVATDSLSKTDDPAVRHLEAELRTTKEHLQSSIEELESSNEELQSSNEELLSMNEELQSSNEELQTSKEEMQSINEEIETVNAELRNKIEEIDRANSDLHNFFQSTSIATIFLDKDLRIKKFTPATTEIFNLIETDINRPLTDILSLVDDTDFQAEVERCLKNLVTIEREMRLTNREGYFMMRLAPYRTIDNGIDGVVITFVSISDIREARNEAEQRARQQSAIAELGLFAVQNSDLQTIFDQACALTKDILHTDFVKLLELEPNDREFRLVSGVGWNEGLVGHAIVNAESDSQAGYALRSNAPVIIHNLQNEIRFQSPALLTDHNVVSGMSVVIYGREKPYGVFGTHTLKERDFTRQEVSFLQSFANVVAAAVQREESIKAMRESEEKFRAMAESVPNLIFTISAEGKTDYINERFLNFIGVKREDLLDTDLAGFVHPEDIEETRMLFFEAGEKRAIFEHNYRFRRSDGEYRWFIGRAVPLIDENGEISRWFGALTEIEEMVRAKNAVEEADRRKDEFMAMLGHELRNPLAPLKNSLMLLRNDLDDTQFAKLYDVMNRQVEQMCRLVDDLLDVSRISHGKIQLHKETVELKNLLQNLASDLQTSIENRDLRLEINLPGEEIWVEGDAMRLTQAIGNVITNAVKFSNRGGRIEVNLQAGENRALLTVRDEGIGMHREAVGRIFDSFTQEDNSLERTRGGLGLGLPLAKGLIEMHDGAISAISEGENKGSEFIVELPRAAAPKSENSEVEKPVTDGDGNRRILVIEDNPDSAETLKILLEMSDHKVETASDGNIGINKAAEFAPEIIICDIGLPGGLSGYDVIAELKKDDRYNSVRFIALSGYGQIEDKEKSAEVGFHEHLVKPVDFDILLEIISKI